jgi:hypothetical protein
MHYAAASGSAACIRLLIKHGASVRPRDQRCVLPLSCCLSRSLRALACMCVCARVYVPECMRVNLCMCVCVRVDVGTRTCRSILVHMHTCATDDVFQIFYHDFYHYHTVR